MITAVALAVVLLSPPKQNAASALVSKMLKYYSGANTMVGTIDYVATDGQGKVEVLTELQYERPSKLYIKQTKSGTNPMQWLVAGNDKIFSYNSPATLPGSPQRLLERVKQIDKTYSVGDIYAVARAASLGDHSEALDIAINRNEDLAHDILKWMTVESKGTTKIGDETANVIEGKWREYGNQTSDPRYAPGTYRLVIADDGKLIQYSVDRKFAESENAPTHELLETWTVDLKPNAKPDETLFQPRG